MMNSPILTTATDYYLFLLLLSDDTGQEPTYLVFVVDLHFLNLQAYRVAPFQLLVAASNSL